MKFYVFFIVLMVHSVLFGQLSVSWPIDRAIFQRNSSNQASINIAGQVSCGNCSGNYVWATIKVLDKYGNFTGSYIGGSSGFPLLGSSTGTFNSLTTINAGWYSLEVSNKDSFGSTLNTISLKFGVGEVIFIAGQSNAQGYTYNNYLFNPYNVTTSYYDCINVPSEVLWCQNKLPSFPSFTSLGAYTKISPNGVGNESPWCYAYLGKKIVDSYNVPVMFINTGASGTSTENWRATANNQSVTTPNSLYGGNLHCFVGSATNATPNGQPYLALKNALNYWGSMFGARTIIWHQGESDQGTDSIIYKTNLKYVIQRTRSHFNNSLGWSISRVSYYGGTTSVLPIEGQKNTKNSPTINNIINYTSWGAYNSDNITSTGRQPDNKHFKENGLISVGDQYFAQISSILSLPSISQGAIPNISISGTGTKTYTAPSGFSYCWVSGNGTMNRDYNGTVSGCYSTNQSISVSSGSYRCYVYTPTNATSGVGGNIRLSQKLFASSVSSGYRISNSINPNVYPNPFSNDFNISVELPNDANVKIDILDKNGIKIKAVTESYHKMGSYNYPVTIKTDGDIYYYRVIIDGEVITKRIVKE